MSFGLMPRSFIASSIAVPDLTINGMIARSNVARSISSSRFKWRSGTKAALRAMAVWLFVRRIQDIVAGLFLKTVADHFAECRIYVVAAELADALAADFFKDAVVD